MFLGFELGLELVQVPLVLEVQLELQLLPLLPRCPWWPGLGASRWESVEATLTLLVTAGPHEVVSWVGGTSCS